MLVRTTRLIADLQVDHTAITHNLATYGPFAATEKLMMAAVRAGADRQVMHELLREHSLLAWTAIREGAPNPLVDLVSAEPAFLALLPEEQIRAAMDVSQYVGDAPERARRIAGQIDALLAAT